MIWNINCRRTRRLLALWVGNDLEQRECQVAERHLAVCLGCRQVWERLQQSQQVLERVRSAPFEEQKSAVSTWRVSVWPWVARHVRSMNEEVVSSSWRNWLPAGAVAAACLGIIVVTLPEGPTGDSVSLPVVMSSPATFGPNPRHLGPFPLGLYREGNQARHERAAPVVDDDPPSF
jgi:hypothetical protein